MFASKCIREGKGHSASTKERGRPCLQQQSITATRATAATSSEVGYCRCTATQNRASEIESTTAEENRNRAHNRKMKEKMCLFYVLLLLLLLLPPTVILPPSLTNNNHDYVLHSILYFTTVFRSRGAICVVFFFHNSNQELISFISYEGWLVLGVTNRKCRAGIELFSFVLISIPSYNCTYLYSYLVSYLFCMILLHSHILQILLRLTD